jgi:hypothetical protein
MKRQKSIMIKIILFYYNLERKKDKKKTLNLMKRISTVWKFPTTQSKSGSKPK